MHAHTSDDMNHAHRHPAFTNAAAGKLTRDRTAHTKSTAATTGTPDTPSRCSGNAAERFDAEGNLTDETTKKPSANSSKIWCNELGARATSSK